MIFSFANQRQFRSASDDVDRVRFTQIFTVNIPRSNVERIEDPRDNRFFGTRITFTEEQVDQFRRVTGSDITVGETFQRNGRGVDIPVQRVERVGNSTIIETWCY